MTIYHAFLWVSHGYSSSEYNNYYPIETKFRFLTYYSAPYSIITGDKFIEIEENPCQLLLGSCPIIPITDKSRQTREAFLPPLLFFVANDLAIPYYGLYHYTIESSSDTCKVIFKDVVLDYNAILARGVNPLTYSTIFKYVTDECAKKGLAPENVSLGLFSCQSRPGDMPKWIDDLTPKHISRIETPATIYGSNTLPADYWITLNVLPLLTTPRNYESALADIRTQGCALNVLAYLDIIPKLDARDQVLCLSLKGTSVFTIIEYVNTYIHKYPQLLSDSTSSSSAMEIVSDDPMENLTKDLAGFVVVRVKILDAITFIVDTFQKNGLNGVVILKMYTNMDHEGKNSHIGHTVAIFRYDDALYFADPQNSIFQRAGGITGVEGVNELIGLIHGSYTDKYLFGDLIYTVYTTNNNGNCYKVSELIKHLEPGAKIINKDIQVKHGGKRRVVTKKNKNKNKNKKKKNIGHNQKQKSKSKKKHHSIRRNRNHTRKGDIKSRGTNKRKFQGGGGGEDGFEKLMLNIDRKNNVKSALNINYCNCKRL